VFEKQQIIEGNKGILKDCTNDEQSFKRQNQGPPGLYSNVAAKETSYFRVKERVRTIRKEN
jgi:hypothetical protein